MRFQKDHCFSRFFFEAIGAKEKLSKRHAEKISLAAASDEGCAPSTAPPVGGIYSLLNFYQFCRLEQPRGLFLKYQKS